MRTDPIYTTTQMAIAITCSMLTDCLAFIRAHGQVAVLDIHPLDLAAYRILCTRGLAFEREQFNDHEGRLVTVFAAINQDFRAVFQEGGMMVEARTTLRTKDQPCLNTPGMTHEDFYQACGLLFIGSFGTPRRAHPIDLFFVQMAALSAIDLMILETID